MLHLKSLEAGPYGNAGQSPGVDDMTELFGLGTSGAAASGESAGGGDLIKDVSEATFMADVVDASAQAPVIVDFWAPWCGPCKTLTPALEAAVEAKKGKIRLSLSMGLWAT